MTYNNAQTCSQRNVRLQRDKSVIFIPKKKKTKKTKKEKGKIFHNIPGKIRTPNNIS